MNRAYFCAANGASRSPEALMWLRSVSIVSTATNDSETNARDIRAFAGDKDARVRKAVILMAADDCKIETQPHAPNWIKQNVSRGIYEVAKLGLKHGLPVLLMRWSNHRGVETPQPTGWRFHVVQSAYENSTYQTRGVSYTKWGWFKLSSNDVSINTFFDEPFSEHYDPEAWGDEEDDLEDDEDFQDEACARTRSVSLAAVAYYLRGIN